MVETASFCVSDRAPYVGDHTLIWVKARPDAAKWDLESGVPGPTHLLFYLALLIYWYPWNYSKSLMQIISLIHVSLTLQSNHLHICVTEEIKKDKKRGSNFCPSNLISSSLIYWTVLNIFCTFWFTQTHSQWWNAAQFWYAYYSEIDKLILQLFFSGAKKFAETTSCASFF